MDLKKGDTLVIHCYKHNGMIYKTWESAIVLDIKEDLMVLGNNNVLVTKKDGRTWKTREPAIMFFYNNRWFNIIAQFKQSGIFYYSNIASPYIIEDRILKYIDYDLDLRVFPEGSFKILDRNEYNYHRRIMRYPKEVDIIIKSELTSLIKMKKEKAGPFNMEIINYYYNLYKELVKKK